MSEITTPIDAVSHAYRASFTCPADEIVNPDRQSLDPERFLKELDRIGWRTDFLPRGGVITESGDKIEDPEPDLFKTLEDADDAAFEEGEEGETIDGEPFSFRNTWSPAAFVASCKADGVDFMVSA